MRITAKTHLAAFLIVEGRHYADIAKQCGISIRTLTNWRADQEFQNILENYRRISQEELLRDGIQNWRSRNLQRQNIASKLTRLVEARANDPRFSSEPGGDTYGGG